jgi:predicted  nucleic acid-binding Zn-ribbon protein
MMDEIQKFAQLKETIGKLSDKKIRLEERFKGEKDRLEKLLAEISEKGYDPKKLSEIRKQKEEDLKKQMENLQTQIETARAQLSLIEA